MTHVDLNLIDAQALPRYDRDFRRGDTIGYWIANMRTTSHFLVFVLTVAPAWGASELLPAFQLDAKNGVLPVSTVTAITQAESGDMYFASSDGLCRFDGLETTVWRSSNSALPGNRVQAMFRAPDGTIWLSAEGAGVASLQDGTLRAESLPVDEVWAFAADSGGAIVAGSFRDGVVRRSGAGDWEPVPLGRAGRDPIVIDMLGAVDGVYLATTDGLLHVATSGVRVFAHDPDDSRSLSHNVVLALASLGNNVLVGTRSGLDLFQNGGFERLWQPTERRVVSVHVDSHENIWIGTDRGLLVARRGQMPPARVVLRRGLPEPQINDIFEDREGQLWFATVGAGVFRLPSGWDAFQTFAHDPNDAETLSAESIPGSISVDAHGSVWAGSTRAGINRIDPETARVQRYLPGRDQPLARKLALVWSALRVGDEVFFGHVGGLSSMDVHTGEHIETWWLGDDPDAAEASTVDLLREHEGKLFVSAYHGGGLWAIDLGTRQLQRYGAENGLRGSSIEELLAGPKGRLWIAHEHGIDVFSGDTFEQATSHREPVAAIEFIGDSLLAATTEGILHGRLQAPARMAFELASTNVALRDLSSLRAIGDMIYGASRRGLVQWNPDAGTVRLLNRADGLFATEFNGRPLVRDQAGALLGSTIAGIVRFHPAKLRDTSIPPLVRIEGTWAHTRPLEEGGTVAWDEDVRIDFQAISLSGPDDVRFSYRLLGRDTAWTTGRAERSRTYNNLPAGSYRFQVRAADRWGTWSESYAERAFRVEAPPWRSTAAYLAYATLVMGLCGIAWQLTRDRLRRERALARARAASEAKSAFVAGLSHEIRTPMHGVLGMADLLLRSDLDDEQRSRAEAIRLSGEHLLSIINQMLDFAKIEAGRFELETEEFFLHRPVEDALRLLLPLARQKQLECHYRFDADVPRCWNGDTTRICQVVLNLLGNAIKFCEQGWVAVRVRRDEESVRIEVADTGVGIGSADPLQLFEPFAQADSSANRRFSGTGLGLAVAREIVQAAGGRIGAHARARGGMCFWFSLPLTSAKPSREFRIPGIEVIRDKGIALRVDARNSAREPVIQLLRGLGLSIVEHGAFVIYDAAHAGDVANSSTAGRAALGSGLAGDPVLSDPILHDELIEVLLSWAAYVRA